ncbi:MAG: exodeoxyribonuclease VII small subunit, partial [Desulfobacterales bacterium]|nr:exodeoxyribonuclease VII small subunit [Desulfobacterales bacterium]
PPRRSEFLLDSLFMNSRPFSMERPLVEENPFPDRRGFTECLRFFGDPCSIRPFGPAMKRTMQKKKFEDALRELEQITTELEEGDLSLEESLDKFDNGMKLAEFCNRKLDEARKRVDILMGKDDAPGAEPFAKADGK